jgi:uncharacterized protein with GYD domain
MLYLGSQGNVRTQTAQVFTAAEVEKLLKTFGERATSQ